MHTYLQYKNIHGNDTPIQDSYWGYGGRGTKVFKSICNFLFLKTGGELYCLFRLKNLMLIY